MKTEAIFENIAQRIIHELNQAQRSIYIAVAWFTHSEIFATLLTKAQQGVSVQLLLSDDFINRKAKIKHTQLNLGQSSCHYVGDGDKDLMHNKFCVIDEHIVINGSYNWSVKAETSNHENIVVTTGDTALAQQFIQQFKYIRQKYVANSENTQPDFPTDKIIKRLEILKNYVILEDEDDIQRESAKLQAYVFHEKINLIIQAVKNHQFSQAISLIDEFVKSNHQLIALDAVEINALKLEIRYLEHQINAYDNEKAELEQLLSQFNYRHTQELGELILELLRLQKLHAQDDPEAFAEAEANEREYQQQFTQNQDKHVFELSADDKKELKRLFRQASQICHPDRVAEEMKEMAHETFIRLKKAYDENDIATVREVLAQLQRGDFKMRSDTIKQKDKLKLVVSQLRQKIQQLENDIFAIKESEEYQTISQIEDWDTYFADVKAQLQSEIDYLRSIAE